MAYQGVQYGTGLNRVCHVKDDKPHTAKAYLDGITLLEIIDGCRKTQAVINQLEALGCDQTEGVAKMAIDETVGLRIRAPMYEELVQYVAPKRRAVDIGSEVGVDFTDVIFRCNRLRTEDKV
jgi:hypothetical protein